MAMLEAMEKGPDFLESEVQALEDFGAVMSEDARQREHQPEKRAKQAAIDANPIEMLPGLRFNLVPDFLVIQLHQVFLDHVGDLAAAGRHRPLDELIDDAAGQLMRGTFGIVKLLPDFMRRAF